MSLDTDGEFERLNALRRYAILDTPPEGAFDRITALAAEMLDAPVAMVSLVDANRIWYKSVHGPAGLREIARGPTLCGAAIEEDGVYMVEQASADPRTQEHPLVTGPFGLEFYIGVPLKTHEGYVLGTLCCMDTRPRSADLRCTDLRLPPVVWLMARMPSALAGVVTAHAASIASSTFR